MKSILTTKPNALTDRDKDLLRDSSIIVVECDDSSSVRWLTCEQDFDCNEVLKAAISSIDDLHSKAEFFDQFAAIVNKEDK